MPETYFTVELPDGQSRECYSPSSVVREFFAKGDEMPVDEFVCRSRVALLEASERVRAKFGFYCSSAMAQLHEIEDFTRDQPPEGRVRIIKI